MVRLSIDFCTRSRGIMSSSASYSGRRYGSTFSCRSPGRNPRLSPASTAGRASTMRRTRLRARASTAIATARYVFPVPAGPMPITMSCCPIACRYSRCPGVFAWITRRRPGRMILYSPSGVRPGGPCSSWLTRRSTSATSSGSPPPMRTRSTSAWATGTARSTAGSGPCSISVSPRNDTRTRRGCPCEGGHAAQGTGAGPVRRGARAGQPGGPGGAAHRGQAMTDEITHRLSTEGVDPLALAGVNDGNLVALAQRLGVRVSLRGDTLMLHGPLPAVERAVPVAQALVDLVRMGGGEPLDVADVDRLVSQEEQGPTGRTSDGEYKIILPGLRRVIQAKTAGQREYLQAIAQHDIVIGIGPAGTGKTYLAVAMAVDALARKRVRRIVLARPAVEAGESLGFLPGDLHEKVDPYLRPLYDALEDMMPRDRVQKAIDNRSIEIAPLAYMRGRTLSDAFVILDEAQNATGMQMKMFLTRLGVNSRAVITGDKTQIDLANREDSGLLQVERILPGIEGIGFCYLGDGDVVRHRLVRDIIRAYAEDAQG